mmetsp:Transcript_2491/g.3872  ORF Transcript_2491/g.3872 Transcript_2491/m.3872 type:complete len:367 (+) Transcript_2491:3-1103(+)
MNYSFFYVILLLQWTIQLKSSHFDTLGISSKASEDDVKKSYRKLAKIYHPDKNKNDPDAQTKFIEITKAYEVLSDPQSRLEYEESLRFGANNRVNSRNSKVHEWRSRNSDLDPFREFHDLRNFEEFTSENMFQKYTLNGKTFYTSSRNFNGQTFTYSYSSSFGNNQSSQQQNFTIWNILYIFGVLCYYFIRPFVPLIILILAFCSLFCNSSSKATKMKNKSSIRKEHNPSNNFETQIEVLNQSYLNQRGVILIIAMNEQILTLCHQLKSKFVQDKVIFLSHLKNSSLNSNQKDNKKMDYLLAVCKGGEKWLRFKSKEERNSEETHNDDEEMVTADEIEIWIIQLLNGVNLWTLSKEIPIPIDLEKL